jgi:putative redox protein
MADAQPQKPPTTVELIWEHDLVLGGRSGDVSMTLDSGSHAGPSPMQALAFALAGCMAMDVVHVLRKGRHDLRGLRADLTGERMPDEPRRFHHIKLHYTITGSIPDEPIARAIQLSREKYCSVWHSMRQDIGLDVTFTVSEGV